MEIKRYLKGLSVVAALLLTASCSNEESEIVKAPQPEVRIIPFEAKVNSSNITRATLSGEGDGSKYYFQTGDQLLVWGTNISGILNLTSGNNSQDATFKGNLTYSGPDITDEEMADISLNAVLKGTSDEILKGIDEENLVSTVSNLSFSPTYPTGIAASNAEAVQKYSYFVCESTTFGAKYFKPWQQSTFISFDITLDDGTPLVNSDENPTELNVSFSSGSITRTGKATVSDDGGAVKAKFTVALPKETQLDNAAITIGVSDPISFGGTAILYGNTFYQVTKTYKGYTMTASASIPAIPMVNPTAADKEKTIKIQGLPYEKTLQDLFNEYDPTYASLVALVSSCTRTSGDNVSVTGTSPDFTFTVTGTGTSKFILNVMSFYNIPVTITVAKAE